MLGMNAALNPPPVALSDEAMKLAAVLLAVASDPAGTKSRLTELNTATQGLRDAIAEHDAAKVATDAAAAGLADLQEREQNLADRENSLIKAQTQLNVASGALASRDEALKSKEAAHAQREADLAKRVDELDRRVESLRLAQGLLEWLLHRWSEPAISLPDIYQRSLNAIGDQATARRLVTILEDHGWLVRIPGGAIVADQQRRDAWRIVREP